MFEFFKVDLNPEPLPEPGLSAEEQLKLYQTLVRMNDAAPPEKVPEGCVKGNSVIIWSCEDAFNYHDESWNEFSVLIGEKISEAEYEQGLRQPELNQSEAYSRLLRSKWNDSRVPVVFESYAAAYAAEQANRRYDWEPHPIARFKALAEVCGSCYIWSDSFFGEIRSWGTVFDPAYWNIYTVAYVTDLPGLPGYFRFVRALGNDRR